MKPPDPELDAALDAVVQGPLDDGRKRVLADLLLERGDPRGEFLLLQFLLSANQGSGAVRQRAEALWTQHRHEWMKGIEQYLEELKLENGFPVSARLRSTVTTAHLPALLASPMLRTLRHLEAIAQGSAVLLAFLSDPRFTQLRSTVLHGAESVLELGTRGVPARLETLHLTFTPNTDITGTLLAAPAFSSLTEVAFAAVGRFFRRTQEQGVDAAIVEAGRRLRELVPHRALKRVSLSAPFGSVAACTEFLAVAASAKWTHLSCAGTFELEWLEGGASVTLFNLISADVVRVRAALPRPLVRLRLLLKQGMGSPRVYEVREALEAAFPGVPVMFG